MYVRYQSYDNLEGLEAGIRKFQPYKIDIGAIFSVKVGGHFLFIPLFFWGGGGVGPSNHLWQPSSLILMEGEGGPS